jgi:membrane-associated protease RseP (regulator of RpoE activity)
MRLWEPFYETWFDGGAKRFEEIAPGEYDLVVVTARQSAATELEELSRRPVTVAPGENRFDVPVPEVEGFTLRADALFAEVYPAEMADLRNRRLSVMLEGGTARCQGLPAGSWRVVPYRGEDDPLGVMIVRVPVAGDVAFVAAPRLEAVVEEVDPGSEAERLGLKPGDVIDSVDGERPRSGFDWSRSLYGLRRADSLKVGVRRAGGGSATLDAPGRLFGPRASSGARIVLRQP